MDKYVDCKTKLHIQCEQGHVFLRTFDSFQRHKKCPICLRKLQNESQRLTYDQVKKIFKDGGCELLDTKYTNYHTPLLYRCNCGRESKIAVPDFKVGKRCQTCGREKMMRTLYCVGKIKTSTQQLWIQSVLGGVLNYVVGTSWLDVAFPTDKIYIEYDGSGHELCIKKGQLTKEEFEKKEIRRTYALYRRGWKLIRIKSKQDKLPSDECLLKIFNDAIKIFDEGSHYVVFDIDEGLIEFNQEKHPYEFGEIHRMRLDCANGLKYWNFNTVTTERLCSDA